MEKTFTADIPDISEQWYRDVVDVADSAPTPVQWFAVHFTEGVILLLGLLLVAVAVSRLRHADPWGRALALVAPAAVVLAYGCSEVLKSLVDEDRPCRGAVAILAGQCPPVGDWSFPSNHATIAGALATAVLLLSPRWGLLAVPLALLAALSRVFVGVHYPHDVLAGLLLGVAVTLLLAPVTARAVAGTLRRRGVPAGREPVPTAPGPAAERDRAGH
ncbi:phosphatase PAP2 family protein [Micromonospora sp. RL09-050-HVF-A]|uniref:phosphatase PAP2 family protein n=1 Tax=Micromonospora sp. RL09-050-HVF-A TaxID=1703433 RepID=UPI001C5E3812|nr:phosphatase PAP2 family protein [Micromonospora sp. RL09-050-HVF-A]MBW4704193.1 phosphatase PAP2 family protein [Micromonospora sp. RL09-050-HVF-A]